MYNAGSPPAGAAFDDDFPDAPGQDRQEKFAGSLVISGRQKANELPAVLLLRESPSS